MAVSPAVLFCVWKVIADLFSDIHFGSGLFDNSAEYKSKNLLKVCLSAKISAFNGGLAELGVLTNLITNQLLINDRPDIV